MLPPSYHSHDRLSIVSRNKSISQSKESGQKAPLKYQAREYPKAFLKSFSRDWWTHEQCKLTREQKNYVCYQIQRSHKFLFYWKYIYTGNGDSHSTPNKKMLVWSLHLMVHSCIEKIRSRHKIHFLPHTRSSLNRSTRDWHSLLRFGPVPGFPATFLILSSVPSLHCA